MRAGRLRKRLTIQAVTTAANEFGEAAPTWADVTTVWGEVRPLAGRELWKAQTVFPDVTHEVTLRYVNSLVSGGLTARHRLTLYSGTRVLHIGAVLNVDERNRTYTLLAQELAGQTTTTP